MNHFCKVCDFQFAFLIDAEPVTKLEKDFCAEHDSDTLLRNPKNEKEKESSYWYYGFAEDFSEIPKDQDELDEYEFCNNCKRFIKKRW